MKKLLQFKKSPRTFFIAVILLFFSISTYSHVTRIRVKQNQDGSLTWRVETYHSASSCGVANSGIRINGVNYALQSEGSMYEANRYSLPNDGFSLFANASSSALYGNQVVLRSYGQVTTPYIPGTLSVQPYSSNVCWAFSVGGNGSFNPPPPPVCTSFPITSATTTIGATNDNGTPCDLSDDTAQLNITAGHLACGNITGDKKFQAYIDSNGSSTYLGEYAYNSGITTPLGSVTVNSGQSYTVRFVDNDFAGSVYNKVAPSFSGVLESTPPTITLNGASSETVAINGTYNDPGATASDNCGSATVNVSGSVNTSVAGTYTISYTAVDPSGNTSTPVSRTVNVIPILAKAKDIIVSLDANGNVTIQPGDLDDGSILGGGTLSIDNSSFDCSNVGNNTVTLTVTSGSSSVSDVATVTVNDDTLPTVITQDISIDLDANGNATITPDMINNGSSDNCGIDTITLDRTNFDCNNFSVSCSSSSIAFNGSGIASGGNGDNIQNLGLNQLTMEAWVKPNGGSVNSIIRKAGDYDLYIVNNVVYAEVWYEGRASSAQYLYTGPSVPSSGWSHLAFTFDKTNNGTGKFYVNGTETSVNGVARSITPDITLGIGGSTEYGQSFTGLIDDVRIWSTERTNTEINEFKDFCISANSVGLEAYFKIEANEGTTLTDYSGNGNHLTISGASWSFEGAPIESKGNEVTLTVTDVNGNVSAATANVTVNDVTPANVVTQDISIDLDASGNAAITTDMIDNGSADACGIESYALDITSFSCANVGVNEVVLTVTDINGNVSTATANVTVNDVTPANVVTQDISIDLDANGNAVITTDMINNGSADACGIESYALDITSFSCANVGVNEVVLTVTDNNGNVSAATANVTVNDVIPANVVTQDISIDLDANGNATITTDMVDNGSADACGIQSYALDITSFSCANVGVNEVVLTVTDNNGNVSAATANVTVNDVTPANVVTQDISIDLDANGNAVITTDMIDNGSADACGIDSFELDTTSFSCANVGVNEVVLTVTDNNGNVSTATANVTVNDVTSPTVITQTATVTLANGEASISTFDVDGGTFDNCSFTLSLDNDRFTCSDIGENTVTLTATDASGNTSSQTATVNVVGDIPTVSINDFNAVQTQKKNTIFLGFGPSSINLSTVVSGGSGFTYQWTASTGETVSSEANPSVSPVVSTTYNVVVTNSNGCTTSTSLYVCVIDARAFDKKGNYKGKVNVCHHTNGKKGTKHVLISISASAVMTHLTKHGVGTDHADSLGACNATCVGSTSGKGNDDNNKNITASISDNLSVYPNPSNGIFDVRLTGVGLDTDIILFDINGKIIERKLISKEVSSQNIITIGNYNLSSGIYLLKIINQNESITKKLVITKD